MQSVQQTRNSVLVRQSEIVRIGEFIDSEEQKALQEWAADMVPFLRPNGKQRAFGPIHELPRIAPAHGVVRRRIEAFLALENADPESEIGWYLSVIGNEGAVHAHKDPTRKGFRHLRCNLFVQTPQAGGQPVIGGRAQPIADRMLLCFFPSEAAHSSLAAQGPRKRILCSFGYLVPEDYSLSDQIRRRSAGRG